MPKNQPGLNPKDADPAGIDPQGAEPTGEGGTEEGATGDGGDAGSAGTAKYTDDDLDEIIQKRLARERDKMEREIRKQIEDEGARKQTEAQKLENMTELQKAQYEAKKLKEEKEALERERDLSNQMAIARRELAAVDINLGDELLAMFVSADAEKTSAAIDQIKELMPKVINEAVQKKLRRDLPAGEQGQGGKSYGAEFAKSYTKSKTANNQNGGKQ